MSTAFARLPFATLVPLSIAATIFATALGSSSVTGLTRIGGPLRWLALAALACLAAGWFATRREHLRGRPPAAVAAAWFLLLCLVSAAWSVDPRLTAERAVSLVVLVGTAALLAGAAAGGDLAVRVLYGVLAGAAAVAVAGLLLLAVDHGAAVRPSSVGVPARYEGLGQSPNTASLLLALALPIAVWVALARHRVVGSALVLLFAGSIAASASRGALVGALAGTVAVIALEVRGAGRGAILLAVTAAAFVFAVAVGRIPSPGAAPTTAALPTAHASLRYVDVEKVFPLEDDLGRPLPGRGDNEGRRTLLGSSGRTAVWRYAAHQALGRPVSGYGFGTEEHVFVDRFANFAGGHVENSYLGLLLQLGVVGLASFLAIVAAVAWPPRRLFGVRGPWVAAAGALVAGLVVALVQSYVYSAGNIAALTFWLAASLTAVGAAR